VQSREEPNVLILPKITSIIINNYGGINISNDAQIAIVQPKAPTKVYTILKTNDVFWTGDLLVSNNGAFSAFLHVDGNLCIYRYPWPDGSRTMWCAGSQCGQQNDEHCMFVHVDGNICVYASHWPDGGAKHKCLKSKGGADGIHTVILCDDGNLCVNDPNGKNVWCSGSIDPIVDIEIVNITYDINNATIIHDSSLEIDRLYVKNDTDEEQTSSVSGGESITESRGWSDSLGVKIGVTTTFKTGIPFVVEGKVTVSAEVSDTFTWNGSNTRTRTFTFTTPVKVPPHQARTCVVVVSSAMISVPYALDGYAVLKSGNKTPITVKGVYTGTNAHDVEVHIIKVDPATSKIKIDTQKVKII